MKVRRKFLERKFMYIFTSFIFFQSCFTSYVKQDLGPKNIPQTSSAFLIDSLIAYGLLSSGKTTLIYLGNAYSFYTLILFGYFIFKENTKWVTKPMFYKSLDGRSILLRTDGIAEIKNPRELNDDSVKILCRFGNKSNCNWKYGINKEGNLFLDVSMFEPEGYVGGFFLEEKETKIVWYQNENQKIEYFLQIE